MLTDFLIQPEEPQSPTLSRNIRISEFQKILDDKYGKHNWLNWEPETILLDFNSDDYLLAEKIYVLKGLNVALNSIISLPEFLLWTTSVCNNENAEFETINIPTCLELAWAIEEIKKIALMTSQIFEPTEELIDILAYLLRLEGFSKPVATFNFIPANKFEPGQTEEDTKMKEQAIKAYIYYMGKMETEA